MFENIILSFTIGIFIFLIYSLKKCFFQVNEGNIAILKNFGKAISINNSPSNLKIYKPGLHTKKPWQKAVKISVMEQIVELSGTDGDTMAMASDGTLLRIDAKLRFIPSLKDLYALIFSMENPLEHTKGLFTCILHQEISCFENKKLNNNDHSHELTNVGSYAAIRSDRGLLNKHIQEFCNSKLGNTYGIQFENVDVTDILPPDELAQSLNAVINAQSEAQRLYALTEGACEQRIMAAKKGIDIAKAKAKATEEDIETMAKILEELQNAGTLNCYIERRHAEVFAESRISYVKRPL